MALFFADLVREACWATGAGDLALGGALPGHRTFAEAVPSGERFHYSICGVTRPDEWETGEGELGSGGTLLRLPLSSSAGGAAVAFSAGLKTVALTANAAWFASQSGEVAIGDVDGLAEALAGKAESAHQHDSAYQPRDSDLEAIAALATTPFGRAHLSLADAAAARTHAGLGSLALQEAGAVAISGGTIGGLDMLGTAGAATFGADATALRTYHDSSYAGIFVGAHLAAAQAYIMGGGEHYFDHEGGNILRLFAGGAAVAGSLSVNGAVTVAGSQVLGARRTGWTAASGTASRAAFETASVSTEALAERVKALIDDLSAHGLIGS